MGLSSGVVCVILRLAVLIQYRSVTDTQTDRHTTTCASRARSYDAAIIPTFSQISPDQFPRDVINLLATSRQLNVNQYIIYWCK